MVTLMSFVPREAEADGAVSKIPAALGGVGLATASMAITLALSRPPPGFDKDAYLLALSGSFLAGVAEVCAAVWVSDDVRGRRAAGKKFVYASVTPLLVSVGLSVASLLCCDENTYFLTLSGAFLAGVTQVCAPVWVYDDVRGRRAAGNKFLYASIAPLAVAVSLWIGGFTA